MAEKPGAQMDCFQQWVDIQETLWKESMAMGRKMLSAMPFGLGDKGISGLTPFDLFKGYFDLMNSWFKAMGVSFSPQMPRMVPSLHAAL